MYSKVLRALSLLLALIMISAVVISCDKASTNEDPETDTQDDLTDDFSEDEFPNTDFPPSYNGPDFEGEEITILIRDNVLYSREWYKESPECELDEAVAMRDSHVQKDLNVNIKYELVPDASRDTFATNFNKMIADDVNSGRHKYDIASISAYASTYASVRGYAANLKDVELFPFFDLSLPCWNQSIVNNTTINGRLHYIAGDINISMFDSATILWFNRSLYSENREDNDPESLMQHAIDGKWTYADLYTLASRFYIEGEDDKEGFYALGISDSEYAAPYDAIPYAWNLDFVVKNNEGTHSFSFENNNKAEEALIKFRTLLDAKGTRKNASLENFAGGHYMFCASPIYWGSGDNSAIREMEDYYGILPIPKYEASQEKYGTTAKDNYNLITVLDHSKSTLSTKGEAVSAYLQLSAEESYMHVRPYYLMRIIRPASGDSEVRIILNDIFNQIVDNIEFDYLSIYSPQLNNIAWLWGDTVDAPGTLEEAYLQNKDAYEQALKDTDAWLGLKPNS